jgi:glycosyltransferase involved in cell wall biosynthesis
MDKEANSLPKVTIGIPTYNGSERILACLESIWSQEYPNLEILISDNCSTDNTQEVVREISKNHPEIKYARQESNVGPTLNFCYLLENATGKYFMWVSDDDKLEPGVLMRYVAFLEENPDYSLVSGRIRYWHNTVSDFLEGGFTITNSSPSVRVIKYYFMVVFGGMMHGLIPREIAQRIDLRNLIGNDFHYVANLTFLGKIKNFDFVGYNKNFGGMSKTFKGYARSIGETKFAANFPQIKISMDAFAEVMHRSKVFRSLFFAQRLFLAMASLFARLLCVYGRIAIWSRIKRRIINPVARRLA